MSDFNDVGEFHEKFGLDNTTWNGAGPRDVSDELMQFRVKFLEEELQELKDGVAESDEAKIADALIDLVYVAMGTAHLRGHPWGTLWDEVQRANMRKVRAAPDASDSKRESSYDVVKPEGWVPPDVEGILKHYGW